jgi:hypothetical protein
MLSTNNTFGASFFADGAETRRHGRKERKGEKLNGKTFSILVIAMLFASIELNQNKSIVKEAFLKVFKLSSLSLWGEFKTFARKSE